jgi:hypothetical protein
MPVSDSGSRGGTTMTYKSYKERLEAELIERATGAADLYLYRQPKEPTIRESLSPPEGDDDDS